MKQIEQLTEEDAVARTGALLTELEEFGVIEGFDRCPGVPCFDVEFPDGPWIQITVRV